MDRRQVAASAARQTGVIGEYGSDLPTRSTGEAAGQQRFGFGQIVAV
jgi:hypothetical protein